MGWVIKCQIPSLANSFAASQLGRKRFGLRQNRQEHSEGLGLAEFGEAVSRTKALSLPGGPSFLASPYTPPRLLPPSHLIRHGLSPACSSAPSACLAAEVSEEVPPAAPSLSQQRQEPPGPRGLIGTRAWTNALTPPGTSSSFGLAWALSLEFQL